MHYMDILLFLAVVTALGYHLYYPVIDPYLIAKFNALTGKRKDNNG